MEELREDQDDGTVARVAAIDIAKASGMVCLRVPHDTIEGRRIQQVWNVASTTNAILELGDRLICQGVERVVMEATGNYWRPFFYLLEARGLDCWLVNARDVKNVPGRPKTDKLDAVWLAKLGERGMVRASFVPPKPVRHLRDFTRTRTVFVQERTRHKHRVDKALQDAQIKLSGAVSDLFGLSARAMMNAMVAGERNPRTLAELAQGSLVKKKTALAGAAARTDTFLGARYRRIVKRRGHAKALVAVARSILVIAWHLINAPDASYQELGTDWHRRHLDPARKTRDLVRQLQALGHQVALTPTSA
ncbi:IS110 family transposase [Streptomyces sp. H34-S4]|uniref:IS110 family transposase n=1 Tax=Streptomyces sp. H34-S4 TaxID=2996463 RepID=UPI00226DEAAB|nr:transposase [Streptomyces sp. H34-S4]MCY0939073.1 transposase [Streptomyces sp. H34-S4]